MREGVSVLGGSVLCRECASISAHGEERLSEVEGSSRTNLLRDASSTSSAAPQDERKGFSIRPNLNGFTLIELMVALVVFSLAAVTLLRLQGISTRTATEISTKTVAQIVAQNIAVDTLTDPAAPTFGTASGVVENAGLQWRWTRTAKRTDDVRLARIDIIVATADGRPGAALSLARALK